MSLFNQILYTNIHKNLINAPQKPFSNAKILIKLQQIPGRIFPKKKNGTHVATILFVPQRKSYVSGERL